MVENKSAICEIFGKHADLGCKHYPRLVKHPAITQKV